MKSNIAAKLSLRAKFKSFNAVELCIIDSETGEVQLEEIPITIGRPMPVPTQKKGKKTAEQVSEGTDIKEGVDDDSNSDENE